MMTILSIKCKAQNNYFLKIVLIIYLCISIVIFIKINNFYKLFLHTSKAFEQTSAAFAVFLFSSPLLVFNDSISLCDLSHDITSSNFSVFFVA